MANARERHVAEIKQIEQQLKTAGPIHKKDLFRHLIRLKRELKQYDLYYKEARMADG